MSFNSKKEYNIEDFIKKELKKQLDDRIIKKEIKKNLIEIEEKNYEEYLEILKELNLPTLEQDTLDLIFKEILDNKKEVIQKIEKLSKEKKEKLMIIIPEILREITFIYSYLIKKNEEEGIL